MAKIAFFHNALGKTDGVSLEVDKWRDVLQRMGHEVIYCAGNDDVEGIHVIPELSFMHPETYDLIQNATVKLKDYDEKTLEIKIYQQAAIIKKQLLDFIEQEKIEILIPNNLLSVGYHLPALIALSEVIEEKKLPTINHNHDFYFEDSGEVEPTCQTSWDILDKYSTPQRENVINLTINKIAQGELKKRKGIEATVVPNVFDFSQPQWTMDEYNEDFRKQIGLGLNDIVLQQATRVMDRKGIELAVDVVAALNQPEVRALLEGNILYNGKSFGSSNKIVLLCTGRIEKFGISHDYQSLLQERADSQGVDLRFVGEVVKHSRGQKDDGRKVFSLWDSYLHSDFVSYPSYWEGWGNQLIEAVFANRPVMLFEYPVYQSDLKSSGLDVVSLGGEIETRDKNGLVHASLEKIQQAADEIAKILIDAERYQQIASHNFEVCKKNYSYDTLHDIISHLLKKLGVQS